LPFAIVPLIHFTSDRARMGAFANALWVRWLAWITAIVVIGLNSWLAYDSIHDWMDGAGAWRGLVGTVAISVSVVLVFLLLWVTFEPILTSRRLGRAALAYPATEGAAAIAPVYHRILVPLDHTALDLLAVGHATAMAKLYGATLNLLHVEEGVTSQIYGGEADTAEVEAGQAYLERIAQSLRSQGIEVETAILHSTSPRKEIVRYAKEIHPDLLIMAAHGHGGLKDLIFGTTIGPVRHNLDIPMLIVRPGKG
jgi:manganese transport protein